MRLILAAVLLIHLGCGEASAQSTSNRGAVSFEASAGYYTVAVGEYRDFYTSVVDAYQQVGVDLPTQTEFPANAGVEGAILIQIASSPFQAGITARHVRTNAYSRYADPNGRVSVDASFRQTLLLATGRFEIDAPFPVHPYVQLQTGPAWVAADLTEDVQVDGAFESVRDRRSLNGTSLAFVAEALVGGRYPLGPVYLTARLGYRIGKANDLDVSDSIAREGETATLNAAQDLSGATGTIGIGYVW